MILIVQLEEQFGTGKTRDFQRLEGRLLTETGKQRRKERLRRILPRKCQQILCLGKSQLKCLLQRRRRREALQPALPSLCSAASARQGAGGEQAPSPAPQLCTRPCQGAAAPCFTYQPQHKYLEEPGGLGCRCSWEHAFLLHIHASSPLGSFGGEAAAPSPHDNASPKSTLNQLGLDLYVCFLRGPISDSEILICYRNL